MDEKVYFTQDGLEKLKRELHELKTKGRSELARAIEEAREKGDLKENAEYDAAKSAQGLHEMKISKLETMLANARIIDETNMDLSKVFILSTVRVRDMSTKIEMKYTLVSEKEADYKSGKIAVNSPVGKGLIGKVVGDTVEIKVPAGVKKFQVMEITREI
jgi:transcription elongation factor GreA